MRISNKKVYFLIVFVLATAAALWGIYTVEKNDDRTNGDASETAVEGIEWNADAITDQAGNTILTRDNIPTSMDVSEEATFGVGGDIVGAQLSPDNTWLALSVSGAAHGGGWLYNIAEDSVHPAVFQYGGNVTPLAWSPNGAFAAFQLETPAATTHLVIVDRNNTDGFVSDIGEQVHVAAEEEMSPPFSYSFRGWQGEQTVCFAFEDGEERCRNADSIVSGE